MALGDLRKGDDFVDLLEVILGGNDDVLRELGKDELLLDVAHFVGLDLLLEEAEDATGASHDGGVEEDVAEDGLEGGLAGELLVDLLVELLDLLDVQEGEATGEVQDLHGDGAVGDLLSLEQVLLDDLVEGLDHISDDLLDGLFGAAAEGLGLFETAVENVAGESLVDLVESLLDLGLLLVFRDVLEGEGLEAGGGVLLTSEDVDEAHLVHEGVDLDGVVDLLVDGLAGGLDETEDLADAGKEVLGVEAEEVLVEFTVVVDGLNLHVLLGGAASDEAGDGAAGPHAFAVTDFAVELAGLEVLEGGALLARRDILGLGELEVLGSLGAVGVDVLGGLLGQVLDHVLGELVELVGDVAAAVDALLGDLPEVLAGGEGGGGLETLDLLKGGNIRFSHPSKRN